MNIPPMIELPRSEARTRFLRLAWIAAKLTGLPAREIPAELARRFNVSVSDDVLEAMIRPVRGSSEQKLQRGPAAALGGAKKRRARAPAVWTDWLRLDEQSLGLRLVLIRIPNDGLPLDELRDALKAMRNIRQVIETKEDREILAIAITRSEEEDVPLRARIEEYAHGHPVRMHVVLAESNAPTVDTWWKLAEDEFEQLRRP